MRCSLWVLILTAVFSVQLSLQSQERSDPASAVQLSNERILYTTLAPINWDLFLCDIAAGKCKTIASHPALDYDAVFSPDGRWLVFTSERSGNADLWALNLVSDSQPIQLTTADTMQDAASFSPDGRSLLFVDTTTGNADIFIMPFDPPEPQKAFSHAKNLTQNPAGDFRPSFSPDGEWIAFSSDRNRSFLEMLRTNKGDDLWALSGEQVKETVGGEIYLMKADGSNLKRLTNANGWDGSPAWARDGTSIFFYSEREGAPRIWRMDANGENQIAVSPKANPALSPTVFPDGRLAYSYAAKEGYLPNAWRIGFVSAGGSDSNATIFADLDCRGPKIHPGMQQMVCYGTPEDKADRDDYFANSFLPTAGHSLVRLQDRILEVQGARRHFPAMSPDGRQIAAMKLLSSNEEEGTHIVIASTNDWKERESFRPATPNFQFGLSWASDWIVFSLGPPFAPANVPVQIWKVHPDGTGAVNLTGKSEVNNAWPDISQDGRRIVYRSGRDDNFEIYVMDADGTNVRRVTDHPARDTMPAISPDGSRVAFSSNRDTGYAIYIVNLDEKSRRPIRLTHTSHNYMHVRFSPDGKWIVFTASLSGFNDEPFLSFTPAGQTYGEIYALRLSDNLTVRLTNNKWEDGPVAWGIQPTGSTRP